MLLMLLKALYSLVLPPACFILLFAVFAVWLYVRTRHRRMALGFAAVTLLFCLTATPLVGSQLTRSLEQRYVPPERYAADVIVMLTGGATRDTPNLDLGFGHAASETSGRLLTAARLVRRSGLPLLVSGGQVFATTGNEADVSKRELAGLGIADERIVLDRTSRNTRENAANSAELMRLHGWGRPLLVTSAAHMPRAVAEFEHVGVDVIPFPTDYKVNVSSTPILLSFIPSAAGLDLTSGALKEYLGLLALRLSK